MYVKILNRKIKFENFIQNKIDKGIDFVFKNTET